jgi:hypothetical protein
MKLFRLKVGDRFSPNSFAFFSTVQSEHPIMSAMSFDGVHGKSRRNVATASSVHTFDDPFALMAEDGSVRQK